MQEGRTPVGKETCVNAIALGTLLGSSQQYFPRSCGLSTIELGVPRVHYESVDSVCTVSSCLDWRADICMTALDAHGQAPDVVVGSVDFLVLRLGYEPVGDVLPQFGERADEFAVLFSDSWLGADLDENDDFTAGMPISVALLVLGAQVAIADPDLRAWALAEVVHTMLPTSAGLVLMPADPRQRRASATAPRALASVAPPDPDWSRIGCSRVPGHPSFFGRSTAYTYLDDARAALAGCRDRTVRVPVR